jgi:hypothetical protein
MSKEQTTLSALSAWIESNTKETYKSWLCVMKKRGFYWNADETLEDCPAD